LFDERELLVIVQRIPFVCRPAYRLQMRNLYRFQRNTRDLPMLYVPRYHRRCDPKEL